MSTVLAQADDDVTLNVPEDGAAWVVFVIVGAVIFGSMDAYWERRDREEFRRLNDPDMAKPYVEPEDDPEPPVG